MKKLILSLFFLPGSISVFAQTEPVPYLPVNNYNTTVSPEFRISNPNTSQFIRFMYQVDTSEDFNSPLVFNSPWWVSGIYTLNYDSMLFDQDYYWRVKSVKKVGTLYDTTDWSVYAQFHTGIKPRMSNRHKNVNFNNVFGNISVVGAGAKRRVYEADTSLEFNSPYLVSDTVTYTNISVKGLHYGEKYYFRSRDITSLSASSYTDTAVIIVSETGASFSYPSFAAFYAPLFLVKINSHDEVKLFEVELDTSLNFNSPLYYHQTASRSNAGLVDLMGEDMLTNTKYYSRVRAIVPHDTSEWSVPTEIRTREQLYLSTPSNGATYVALNTPIKITGVNRVYNEIQLDTTADFSSAYKKTAIKHKLDSAATDYYSFEQDFGSYRFNTKYYYRARFYNSVDTAVWSTVYSFTTRTAFTRFTAPTNNREQLDPEMLLSWSSMQGVSGYQIHLSTDSFQTIALDKIVADGDSFFTPVQLEYNTLYDARIRIINNDDTTEWLDKIRFKTMLPLVEKESPYDSSGVLDDSIHFEWKSAGPGFRYEIGVWTEKDFNKRILTDSTTDSFYYFYPPVRGEKYFWDVKLIDGNYKHPTWFYGRDWEFVPVFKAVVLTSPANGAVNQPVNNMILRWEAITGAQGYQVEVDLNPQFTGPLKFDVPVNNAVMNNLPLGKTIYWRVRAYRAYYGVHSQTFTFVTGNGNGTAVNELAGFGSVYFYPNPFTDKLRLVMPEGYESVLVKIISAEGKLVKEVKASGSDIETADLPSGIYTYQVFTESGVKTGKIIKVK